MENLFILRPLFMFTKFGLGILYILRDVWHRPDRNFIEGPSATLARSSKSSMTRAADIPSHRYEFGAAAIGKTIYVAGGIFQPSVWLPSSRFESYHQMKDIWERLPDLPHVTHHPGVAADGKYVYIVGGCGLRITPLSFTWRYEPNKKLWERLPDMPTRRGALGLACIDGKLYAVGGADYGKKYKILESYDIATKKWERLPDMPTPREHLAVAVCRGKLHVLGGYHTDRFGALTSHEVYDPKTRSWKTYPPIPMRLCGFAALGRGDSIYIFGGEQGWAVSHYIFEYDTIGRKWFRHPDLEEARYASAAAGIGKHMHILGGNTRMFSDDFSARHDVFTL